MSHKNIIVLDVDHTLVSTFDDMDAYNSTLAKLTPEERARVYTLRIRDPNFGMVPMWGLFRPQVFEFLTFCQNYFSQVMIWSAGQPFYVNAMVELLFS